MKTSRDDIKVKRLHCTKEQLLAAIKRAGENIAKWPKWKDPKDKG